MRPRLGVHTPPDLNGIASSDLGRDLTRLSLLIADDVASSVGSAIDETVIAVSGALGDNRGRVERVNIVGEETVVGLALSSDASDTADSRL